jgi:hypothetical protein
MATKTTPQSHPAPGKSQFMVDTPEGMKPFVPPPGTVTQHRPAADDGSPLPDNPDNPRGKPSLSLPQQATPLTSQQGVANPEDLADPDKAHEIMGLQDGQAPDDPMNPHGTPDYIIAPEDLQGPDALAHREERRRQEAAHNGQSPH